MGKVGTFIRSVNRRNISAFLSRIKSKGIRRAVRDVKDYEEHRAEVEDSSELPMLMELVEPTEGLIIPVSEHPKVSIIIPVYNHYKETYNCIKSVIENSGDVEYEIIVGDDCSTDETVDIGNQIHNVIVNRNKTNTGFTLNCNNASELARGDYVLFLNNDTLVEKDWLSPLVELIESDATIGMVGSKLVYPTGRLQEAGGILWSDGSAWNYGNCQDPDLSQFNYVKETDYISGAAIMIRRSLFEEIGRFDARYAPAYCEDSDLAFEVRRHGCKVVYQPKSVVYHFEGVSNGKVLTAGLKAYQVVNQTKFMDKWRDVLEKEHRPNAVDVFHARDRTIGKRTVVVFDDPGEHRSERNAMNAYAHAMLFKGMGFVVKVLSPESEWIAPYIDRLQQNGIETAVGDMCQTGWGQWLRDNSEYIDFIFINSLEGAMSCIDVIKGMASVKIVRYDKGSRSDGMNRAERKVDSIIRDTADILMVPVSQDTEGTQEKRSRSLPDACDSSDADSFGQWLIDAKSVYSGIVTDD